MEHQFRRGIYRPNAQRLSISLAPLVAQRSLLFRVQTDLSRKVNYGELTPMSEGSTPALFPVTASAHLISAALSAMSAMSSGSVYSQDSYRSPFVPADNVDTRRQAIVFSASLQWTDLFDEDVDLAVAVEDTLGSASIVEVCPAVLKKDSPCILGSDVSTQPLPNDKEFSADNGAESQVTMSTKSNTAQNTSATKLKKKKPIEASNSKRISKHFGKVMSRMSIQPSKKELSEKRQANALSLNIVHLTPGCKLPEIRTPRPIHMSFIVQPSSAPAVPALPVFLPSILDAAPPMENSPHPSTRPSTTPRLPSTPAKPAKKGHRRYKSSPAVANFNFKGWDTEDMPPLPIPAMPLSFATPAGAPIPTRPRPRTVSLTKAKPVIRSVSPPVPLRSGKLLLG